MKLNFCVLLGTAVLGAMPGEVRAGVINWGTHFNDELYDADGDALTGDFTFELGTFPSGFTPSLSNAASWAGQWKMIEPGDFNVTQQYVAETSLMTESGGNLRWERDTLNDDNSPLTNSNVFAPGERVYLWVYNHKAVNAATQWGLITGTGSDPVTDDWRITSALGDTMASFNWYVANATQTVVGGLNDVRGAGYYTTAAPSSFSVQTALLSPVPEPGSALMAALSAAGLLMRRRRPAV